MSVSKKVWAKPEVKALKAGAAEIQASGKADGIPSQKS
jgi:hypothetical protein